MVRSLSSSSSGSMASGRRGLKLRPPSKDAYMGPSFLYNLASIYARVGEVEVTLDRLEELLSKRS